MTPLDRRAFLQLTAAAGCAACLPLAGCAGGEESAAPEPLRIPLAELPEGERVTRRWGRRPVELLRRGDSVTVRSLRCTHQGCTVRWRRDEQVYFCPCHDGKFDAAGAPVYGPPREPLREYAANVVDGHVVVEPPESAP
jgi:Rieske Fe-S protein